jgi:DNA-directed RNA polymerase subunit RPC12/RpoP
MRLTATCSNCGLSFEPSAIKIAGGTEITFKGSSTNCPRCGHRAPIKDGTYDFFLDGVVKSFREVDEDQLRRFREIVQAAAVGGITAEQAEAEANKISSTFGAWLKLAMQWGIPALLVAVLSLYISWLAMESTDRSSAAILRELQLQSQTDIQISQQLQTLNEAESRSPPPAHSPQTQPSSQKMPTAGAPTNRHERRKAAKFGKPKPSD